MLKNFGFRAALCCVAVLSCGRARTWDRSVYRHSDPSGHEAWSRLPDSRSLRRHWHRHPTSWSCWALALRGACATCQKCGISGPRFKKIGNTYYIRVTTQRKAVANAILGRYLSSAPTGSVQLLCHADGVTIQHANGKQTFGVGADVQYALL
jgi:hypothetical protein